MPYASYGSMGLPVPSDASLFAAFDDAQTLGGFAGFSTLYARYADYPTAQAQADGLYAAIAQETPTSRSSATRTTLRELLHHPTPSR